MPISLILAAVLALTLQADTAHAANFNVINTNDSGPGTLRTAILRANANANPADQDNINFTIPADTDAGCDPTSGVCTIFPQPDLPDITEPAIIDGYTQDGASPNTLATGNDAQLKVELSGEVAGGGANGLRIRASDCVVRGMIINGWSNEGVEINGLSSSGVSGNRIEGNFLGTDATGEEALGNVNGVRLVDDASDNVVGGTSPAARNVISGNDDDGVELDNGANDRVQGNYIGTDASGQGDLGNGDEGVHVLNARNTAVGGTSAAASNTIAFNAGDGVDVDGPAEESGDPGTGNSILRNSIHSNGGLGIDLNSDNENPFDVTPNDAQDPDPGPNLLQNFPLITSAETPNGTSITVRGTLNSTPSGSFNVQLFASPEADPSGYGEGQRYLGQTNLTTNAGGNASFSFSSPNASVAAGEVVTATATNSVTGDTSEFSEAFEVEDDTAPTVVSTNPPDGATGVSPTINVTATFSERMDPSTVNENSFRLFERVGATQQPVAVEVSYNATFKRALLRADGKLNRGSRYVTKVTTGARDLAGNRLAQTEVFTFTVRQ